MIQDTITGKWTWAYALGDNLNKQMMKISVPGTILVGGAELRFK